MYEKEFEYNLRVSIKGSLPIMTDKIFEEKIKSNNKQTIEKIEKKIKAHIEKALGCKCIIDGCEISCKEN